MVFMGSRTVTTRPGPTLGEQRSGVRDCSTATGLPAVCVLRPAQQNSPRRIWDLPLLVISQFTLYANTGKVAVPPGMRRRRAVAEPPWTGSWKRCGKQAQESRPAGSGADMQVRLTNDGPITVLFEV